ncbi:MAG: septal ring lytic transglycosylase RlpA family protein [Candidatus Thiodiazotropha sp. (ex Lucinoma aequizonata)]|nr:septal ring lytic transglycosylase RlpA family protein [Candidatus Thiodiazotropha sp. (ex Lucinoma aequizonata)]MCU7887131.1 septal ring lytic transglycosylase RlpA family protein [Candidatus Thiodiazotropha sp. (ex Lucinoma aequizonata)]MCU7896146.1 septal ring lytic transglycosylase RlpA family protein [Candidatus Thiodiazotropha sp. (ex Lucinoma aequizonata)]MCU7898256.1 septal ring lytic transglycosylase RlpA family protein [Candidatus Thiodiazotropha sp. (ex Lucinoma aequizonata)]MCU79
MLIVGGCSTGKSSSHSKQDGVSRHHPPPVNMDTIPDAVPKVEAKSRYGNPASYMIFGKRYHTLPDNRDYSSRGIASWYGSKFHGQRTSSGESYDMYAMTAAHKKLPLPSYVRVTNLKNSRSVVVKVNDRGPFHDNRLIDLSYTAAWKLGIIGEGTGLVEVVSLDQDRSPPPPEVLPVKLKKGKSLPELFLQVGAFGSSTNAHRLKKQLEEQLQAAVIIENKNNTTHPVYRVQVGPIASVKLADHLSQRLDQLGILDPHVVIRLADQ